MSDVAAVIACGSRDWSDEAAVFAALEDLRAQYDHLHVIEGRARGADRIAGSWAIHYRDLDGSVSWCPFYADWKRLGRAAGPVRNLAMLDRLLECQDLGWDTYCVAFKDGFNPSMDTGGTEHMVAQAARPSIPTMLVSHGELSAPTRFAIAHSISVQSE